ncbi:MAG TPA: menaquinone biosynthesis protein [Candidatus Acidoferrales bacterium]|nr:menaquinone biosynthesis protein [Candidatus Acidoferrales bacterium]
MSDSQSCDPKDPPNKKKIGAVSFLNTKPLIYGIEKNIFPHNFQLTKAIPSALAVGLNAGRLDVALVPSIAYAKNSPELQIVPDCGIIAHGKVKSIRLYFNRNLKSIRSVAVDISSVTSVVLTKILLAERFEVKPEFIAAVPDVERMLAAADAALVIGDSALFKTRSTDENYLDLAEEWHDMTGLPFVFAVWAGRRGALETDELQAIISSKILGQDNIDAVCHDAAAEYGADFDLVKSYLTENVQFDLREEEISGMKHFFELSYYHGALEYLPLLNFYPLESTAKEFF